MTVGRARADPVCAGKSEKVVIEEVDRKGLRYVESARRAVHTGGGPGKVWCACWKDDGDTLMYPCELCTLQCR